MGSILIDKNFISEKDEIKKNTTSKKEFIPLLNKSEISRDIKITVNHQSDKKVTIRKK